MDELLLRELTPAVIGVLVHRGVDFATAEDAVQEALIQAALTWPDRPPTCSRRWCRQRRSSASCSPIRPIRANTGRTVTGKTGSG